MIFILNLARIADKNSGDERQKLAMRQLPIGVVTDDVSKITGIICDFVRRISSDAIEDPVEREMYQDK